MNGDCVRKETGRGENQNVGCSRCDFIPARCIRTARFAVGKIPDIDFCQNLGTVNFVYLSMQQSLRVCWHSDCCQNEGDTNPFIHTKMGNYIEYKPNLKLKE